MAKQKKLTKKEQAVKKYIERNGQTYESWRKTVLEKAMFEFMNSNSSVRKEFEANILEQASEEIISNALSEYVESNSGNKINSLQNSTLSDYNATTDNKGVSD